MRRLTTKKGHGARDICMTSRDVSTSPNLPQRRAPRQFVRLQEANNMLLLQTAVIIYSAPSNMPGRTLQLHPLLHVADLKYYEELQRSLQLVTARRGMVIFELVTSMSNVSEKPYLRVKKRPRATAVSRASAAALGGVAQADRLDPTQPRWRLADVPIEETAVARRRSQRRRWSDTGLMRIALNPSALRPTIAPLLLLLPCPELYAALLDLATGRARVSWHAVHPLLRGDILRARRVAFAGRITASASDSATRAQTEVDRKRNAAAWRAVVDASANTLPGSENGGAGESGELALLYGAWHANALCSCAEADGWRFSHVTWRTAMATSTSPVNTASVTQLSVAFAAYIAYAAFDWVCLVDRIAIAFSDVHIRSALPVSIALYFTRHVAPYVLFRRWFFVWDDHP